ncbi:MAG: hypothetical protein Kow0080_10140 [Candidatus Promineifilaceae bacterium]
MTNVNQMWPRVVDIEAGTAVVVTDLHGDWDAYQQYRDCFLQLHHSGQADYFLLLGDLIHHTGPEEADKSLDIVLDVQALQKELGDRVICLLGNHEMAHIYTIPISKGNYFYTPRFEHALGPHRETVIAFFDAMPFYVRSKGGVAFCHAGATSMIGQKQACERLFTFSHKNVLLETAAALPQAERPYYRKLIAQKYGMSYDEIVRSHFAVTADSFHRYDDFLIGITAHENHPDMALLWSALFNKNEYEYGRHPYKLYVNAMLQQLSVDYHPQHVLVTGHIDVKGGYQQIGRQQLRLASAKHANPREAGLYLLVDLEKEIRDSEALIPHLASVFDDE